MIVATNGPATRCDLYFRAVARKSLEWLDPGGCWISSRYPELIPRERFWLAFALYGQPDAAFADAVVRAATLDLGEYPMPTTFNIFHTNIAVLLLVKHGGRMAPDVRDFLEGAAREGFSFLPGNRQPDYQFHGYNDNMPAKATMGLILGGEMLGNPEAVEHGLWNLRQLRAQLVRRGINSECNSPTYTPLTIHAMASIVEYACNETARELALGIEQRLWLDLASRFHPGLGVQAGPYSRAYTSDCLSHLSCLSAFLWFELGDLVKPSPLELFDEDSGLVLHHAGDLAFNAAQMCWFPGRYHLPPAARRLLAAKTYPHRAVATGEWGDFGPDFPARPFRIETWMGNDFALGTMSSPMGGGEQTANYFVNYARRKKIDSFRDRGTIYSKMVINDEQPGERRKDTRKRPDGSSFLCSGEADNLTNRASTIAFQSETTALLLTHPHVSLGGSSAKPATPLTSLSELILFPSHFGGADEVSFGGKAGSEWQGETSPGTWFACRRGRLLAAFRPLVYTRALAQPVVTLEKVGGYEVIRTTFYQGEPRLFSRDDLLHTFGGFVAEHASVDEYPTLEDFVAEIGQASVVDYLWTTRRVEFRRPAGRRRPALEIEISCSPGALTPRHALVNGRLVEGPVLDLDGVAAREIPFLGEPWTPTPAYLPWDRIEVAWASPPVSAIGSWEGKSH